MKSFVRAKSLGAGQTPPHSYRMFVTALGTGEPIKTEEGTERDIQPARTLFSPAVNDPFSLFIKLPHGYLHEGRKRYKTVYLLDADLYFGYLADSPEKTNGNQSQLIGIEFKNLIEVDSLRNRYYTYPIALLSDSFTISGSCNRFYEFITVN